MAQKKKKKKKKKRRKPEDWDKPRPDQNELGTLEIGGPRMDLLGPTFLVLKVPMWGPKKA